MTLVELLAAMSLFLIISAAALMVLASMQRESAADVERAKAIQEAEVGLKRMTRELRQATTVTARTPDVMQVTVQRPTGLVTVRYACDAAHPTRAGLHRCVRTATENGVTRSEVVVDRLLNGASDTPAGERVFQYPGRASYVRAQVIVPAAGERVRGGFAHRVVLDDGFYMRNCDASCSP
jgi:type II secretory pathway pseudopilin PulG